MLPPTDTLLTAVGNGTYSSLSSVAHIRMFTVSLAELSCE